MNHTKDGVEEPLISIIIRTCQRPEILKRAIESVKNQDYKNIEVVIVEDGINEAEAMLASEYADMRYVYFNTGEKVGRAIAGNEAMSRACGIFYNFLDDDDILLPNHISTLVKALQDSHKQVAYSIAEEHQIRKSSRNETEFKVKRRLIRYSQPYNRLLLSYINYLPIQSVMFHRSLFEKLGGFDSALDFLEDWELWVRYSTDSDFVFVPELTSVYYTPYKSTAKQKRDVEINKARECVVQKFSAYTATMDVEQMSRETEYLLTEFRKKSLLFYLKKARDFLIYRDV